MNEVGNESEDISKIPVLHETSTTTKPTAVSITEGHAVLHYDPKNATKTAAANNALLAQGEPMDISEVLEAGDPREKAFRQSDERMQAIIALLEDSGERYPNNGPNQPHGQTHLSHLLLHARK